MSEVDFQVWEFEEAPADLRELIAEDFRGGWLALVSSSDPSYLARIFSMWWHSAGLPLEQCDAGEGQIVLAGPHPDGQSQRQSPTVTPAPTGAARWE